MKKLSKRGSTKPNAKKSKSLSSFSLPNDTITSYINTSKNSTLNGASNISSISNSIESHVEQATFTKNSLANMHDNNCNAGSTRKKRSNAIGMTNLLTENLTNISTTESEDKCDSTLNRDSSKEVNLQTETTQCNVSIKDVNIVKDLCNEYETALNNSSLSVGDLDKFDNKTFLKNSTLKRSSRLRSLMTDDVEIQISQNKCVLVSPNSASSINHESRQRSGSFNNEYETINSHIINMIHDVGSEDEINRNDILTLENVEAIEMVHDFESMMKFDNVKIPLLQSPIASIEPAKYTKKNSPLKSKRNKRNIKSEMNLTSVEKSLTSRRRKNEEINEKTILQELKAITKHRVISKEKQEKLKILKVNLRHEVPNQHTVETHAGTHAPTFAERKIISLFARMKSGPYTAAEDTIILGNWQKFCELHDWDPKDVQPFLYMRQKSRIMYIPDLENRRKFVQFLAKDLPHRTLYSVYHRFRNLLQKFKSTRYTEEEDKKILAYLGNGSALYNGTHQKYADLAVLLNRTRCSIFRRYRLLLKKSSNLPTTNVRWTLPMIEKFINAFLRTTKVRDVKYLKDVKVPLLIWKKLALKLNIHYDLLKRFWRNQLHLQLFCKEPIYMNDVKVKLIEYAYGKGLAARNEFNWNRIKKYFDGFHASHLCRIFQNLLERIPHAWSSDNLWEAIEYLYEVQIPKIRNAPSDRMLPRISFKNGKAKLIDKRPTK